MEFVTAGFFPSLIATVTLVGVVFACYQLGGLLLRVIESGEAYLSFLERLIFSIGIGFIVLALCLLGVGSAGLLTRDAAVILLMSFAILPFLFSQKGRLCVIHREDKAWFLLLAGTVLFLAWIQAVSPPIGNDDLAYHLAHSRQFVLAHKISYLPDTRESLWPYQTEMFYTLGLLLHGASLAILFHWFFLAITACAVYALGQRLYDVRVGRLAAVVFLFTPAVVAQAGYAYVDLSLAFYVLLSVYALILAEKIGYLRAALLSGIACGGALSTKYLALGAFAVLLMLWILYNKNWKAAALFLGASVLVSAVWYLRSWIVLGNPVYPFFYQFFNGNGYPSTLGDKVGMGKGPLSFLLLGWNLTMHPASFGGEKIGPLYLLFLPLLAAQRRLLKKESLLLLLFSVFYTAFIFTQSQQARFFLSVVPPLCLLAGVSLAQLTAQKGTVKRVTLAVVSVVVLLHLGVYFYRTRDVWAVWLGGTGAHQYLMRHERSFQGHAYLKESAKAGERLFNAGEGRRFYDSLRGTVDYTEPFRETLRKKGLPVYEFLDQNSFDYIWLKRQSDEELWEYVKSRGYTEVFSYKFVEGGASFYSHIFHKSPSQEVPPL